MEDINLDMRCQMMLAEYERRRSSYEKLLGSVKALLGQYLGKEGGELTLISGRVKKVKSLAGKLALKGQKYASIEDITDLVGLRIVMLYNDGVEKAASIVEKNFDIDWDNTVDKRKTHDVQSFGYNSVHYICRLTDKMAKENGLDDLKNVRFEIQIRSTLQHVWAAVEHDIGYKSDIDVPSEYVRSFGRLAGMLELIDEEFSRIRMSVNEYRHRMEELLKQGQTDKIELTTESFTSFLHLEPFKKLNERIAAVNHAEIFDTSLLPYCTILKQLGMKTLGDVEQLVKERADDAFHLARYQIGNTDLDIMTSAVGIQNLCIAFLLRRGCGKLALKELLDYLYGESEYNDSQAENLLKTAKQLGLQ